MFKNVLSIKDFQRRPNMSALHEIVVDENELSILTSLLKNKLGL